MKTTIFVLILATFLQTTLIPLNLVLIILICRSLIIPERENLFLAFAFGLLAAFLNLNNLGFYSLIFLILIFLTQAFSKTRFSNHSSLIIPIAFILLSIETFSNSILMRQSAQIFPSVLIESIIALPIFYLVRMWEERFIVRKDIKLKF